MDGVDIDQAHRVRRHPDGLIGRLEAFFEANPEEELTYDDVCSKFGAVRKSACNQIAASIRNGGSLEVVTLVRRRRGGE